jgi:hypothetical protein
MSDSPMINIPVTHPLNTPLKVKVSTYECYNFGGLPQLFEIKLFLRIKK